MAWEELSAATSGATWRIQASKNKIYESGADFQEVLSLRDMGEGNMSIEDDFFQINDLEQTDTVG